LQENTLPRIPDELQSSIVFIYPNTSSARDGKSVGGTGFFVEREDAKTGQKIQYLITNTHVAQFENRAIKFCSTNGSCYFHEIKADEWVCHPNGADISAVVLPLQEDWNVTPLDLSALGVTQPRMDELNMGVGDEVFMLGRFISHNSLQLNQPLARFGNIAMMPGQTVKDGRGLDVEAFLVEMRSLSGFSGSPVFVYMGPGTYRGNGEMMPFYSETIGLIGIDTGHKVANVKIESNTDEMHNQLSVPLNTGISIVAPMWRIDELLDSIAL